MATLQGQIQATASQLQTLQQRVDGIQREISPTWPVITKFHYRTLLTPIQELIWDNYDVLKTSLGLTDEQFMQLRTFRARFESAEKITMTDDYMVNGLNAVAAWNLTYNAAPVFTVEDAERILAGQVPTVSDES